VGSACSSAGKCADNIVWIVSLALIASRAVVMAFALSVVAMVQVRRLFFPIPDRPEVEVQLSEGISIGVTERAGTQVEVRS
jgi:multidrug efflux pump subunit AcrB